jgi:hypothetical protein
VEGNGRIGRAGRLAEGMGRRYRVWDGEEGRDRIREESEKEEHPQFDFSRNKPGAPSLDQHMAPEAVDPARRARSPFPFSSTFSGVQPGSLYPRNYKKKKKQQQNDNNKTILVRAF